MDQESKIHTKCKIENCQWGAHPKTGLCSHHDPWLSRRVKWRQIQREEQEVKITKEIITRQRGMFGDKSNNELKKNLNQFCINNKLVYYLSKEGIYTTILCLKLPKDILRYIFDYLKGIFLITAEQARMLCPNRYYMRIHQIYPHVADCFNIKNQSLVMCYYQRKDISYSKEMLNRNEIIKQFDVQVTPCFCLPEPVEHPVLVAVAVKIIE
jgi:hypothetical protein